MNPDRNGYLWKDGGNFKRNFKKRWVVVSGGVLYYFKREPIAPNEGPHGIVPVDNLLAESWKPKKSDGFFYFKIVGQSATDGTPQRITGCKKKKNGQVVQGSL